MRHLLLSSTAIACFLLAQAALGDGPRRPEERGAVFRSAPLPRQRPLSAGGARTPGAGVRKLGEGLRKPALEQRGVALLMAEIRELESLLASTARNSPDRSQLIRRLAEDYAELAASAQRERIQAEIQLDLLRRAQRAKARSDSKP